MKQKQSPVLLITVLVIAGGSIMVANSVNIQEVIKSFTEKKEAPVADDSQKKAASDADKAAIKQAAAEQAKAAKSVQNRGDGEIGEGSAIPATPTILVPKMTKYKQTVNEASVSSQWFKDNSNVKNREADLEKKKAAAGG